MDIKLLKQLLLKHKTIILHRHIRPDMDAIGSQLGLKHCLKANFPDKNIYSVGDINKFDYNNEMDIIPDETYKDCLVIITDVSVSSLISDDRYKLAKDIVIIDHHENPSDVLNALLYVDCKIEAAVLRI